MSKIFEALQYAQTERQQREKIAEQRPGQTKENMQMPEPCLMPKVMTASDSCNCEEHRYRVRQQGIWDFFLRLCGFYPWQCSQCNRCFYRLQRF